jgi:hypothetical protein
MGFAALYPSYEVLRSAPLDVLPLPLAGEGRGGVSPHNARVLISINARRTSRSIRRVIMWKHPHPDPLRASSARLAPQAGEGETHLRLLATHCARAIPSTLSFPKQEGAGNAGCRLAPAVSWAMCTRKCAHEHTGTAGAARHSLRDGFTAYTALSPETNSFCLRRRRIEDVGKPGWVRNISAGLTPATGARTTRLCRPLQSPSSARGLRS